MSMNHSRPPSQGTLLQHAMAVVLGLAVAAGVAAGTVGVWLVGLVRITMGCTP
jgi:hypothetical protein